MKRESKRLTFQNTIHTYEVSEEGLVINQSKQVQGTTVAVTTEPDFVKLYLNDVVKLHCLPKTSNQILRELLKLMAYDNTFRVTAYDKRNIASKLDISSNTINNALVTLTNEGITTRLASGVYMFNPNIFGKGKWQDIQKLRVTIEYDHNGRQFHVDKVYEDSLLDIKVAGINEEITEDTKKITPKVV